MARSRAFTTIELLLATALAAVLMIGVLRVVGSIRPDAPAGDTTTNARWPGELIALLRTDLTHATALWQENNQLTLIGYAALDRGGFGWRGTGESTRHHPVEVRYRLWSAPNGQTWLLRRQAHTVEQTNRNAWSEVIAHNVARFEIRRPGDHASDLLTEAADVWLDRPGPVPDQVQLVVQLAGNTEPAIDTLVTVR